MGERQRVSAKLGEKGHPGGLERLDGKLDLDVPELADIEVTSSPPLRPSEEDVAGRLHEAEAVHNALPVVRVDALSRKALQHRGARLFDLENEGISVRGPSAAPSSKAVPTLPTPTTLTAASIIS